MNISITIDGREYGLKKIEKVEAKGFTKNYKITSFVNCGKFVTDMDKYCSKNQDHSIYTVERIRDNKIFFLGQETNYGIIEGFFVGWAGMEVHFKNGCGATLESIQPLDTKDYEILNTRCLSYIDIRQEFANLNIADHTWEKIKNIISKRIDK